MDRLRNRAVAGLVRESIASRLVEIQEAMRGYEALEFDRSTRGFSSVRGCRNGDGGIQFARSFVRRAVRDSVWRGVGLRGIARRTDRFRFDSHAVLSISILRAFGRATNFRKQYCADTGSAGESVAAGVIFTLPALIFLDFLWSIRGFLCWRCLADGWVCFS